MADYDSILKEEKKYDELEIKDDGPAKFPWFTIDLILLSIVLVVSYVIYYNIILTPEKIFLNDLNAVALKYGELLEPLKPSFIEKNNQLKGTISLNDNSYNFLFSNNKSLVNFNLSLDDKSVYYSSNNNLSSLKVSEYSDSYYKINNINYYNNIVNFIKYIKNEKNYNKFIKKVYVDGTVPIVESNLVLSMDDIKKSLNIDDFNEEYKVLFTFKNNAITNKIISMKIVINKIDSNERIVIQYKNNQIIYKDDNSTFKLLLKEENNNVYLEIKKNDKDYSILSRTKTDNKYQYSYQLLNKGYLVLNIDNSNSGINYQFLSSIEKNEVTSEKIMNIALEKSDDKMENVSFDNVLNYNDLAKEEKDRYQDSLNNVIGEILEFINDYK